MASHPHHQLTVEAGYVTLMTVLIMVAAGVAIATSLLLLGVGNIQTSQAVVRANEAAALADGCAEDALQRLRIDSTTTGSVTLPVGTHSCSYTITDNGGENRTIDASGTVAQVIKRVVVIIDQLTPTVNVSSWQEVADF